jgi:hypothetical protein
MRIHPLLAYPILALALLAVAACSGVEIERSGIEKFSAGQFKYYKWRSEPLPSGTLAGDPMYTIDPVIRRDVDAALQGKGYVLDPERAQFTVDYRFVRAMQQGEKSQLASNVTPFPRVVPNRQNSQAVVDNAIALGGVKETNNIVLQFNDVTSNEVVWQASLSKIVQDANNVNDTRLDDNLQRFLTRALNDLPPAAGQQ